MQSTPILQFGTSRFLQAHADLFISQAMQGGDARQIDRASLRRLQRRALRRRHVLPHGERRGRGRRAERQRGGPTMAQLDDLQERVPARSTVASRCEGRGSLRGMPR